MNPTPRNLRRGGTAVPCERTAEARAVCPPLELKPANSSSHRAIYELLHSTQSASSYDEFTAWNDAPNYDAADRTLLTISNELFGHAHLAMRYASFGGVRLPIALLREVVLRSEVNSLPFQAELLAHVERSAVQRGAVLMLLCGQGTVQSPPSDWHPLPVRGFSEADPQEVLAHVRPFPPSDNRQHRGERVVLWRRTDLDSLMEIHAENSLTKWGSIVRNEACWQWLLGRSTHDIILVTSSGRKSPLTGYAIAKRNHVLEVLPMGGESAERLVGRLCRDAVDQGDHTLTLHTPSDDPLHQLMLASGGRWCDTPRDNVRAMWCKLLDRRRWAEALFPIWRQRVRAQGFTLPCALSIELPDRRCELVVSRRSSHWVDDASTETIPDLTCDETALATILVGNLDWQSARDAGNLILANPQAIPLLTALFSRSPWHFTLLDWL